MNNNKIAMIIMAVLTVLIVCYFIFKPVDKPETVYIKGKDSVVTKSDTVIQFVPKFIVTEKIISDTVHITHFQTDSSIVRDTVIQNMDTVIATITTYPKVDSLKYNLDLRLSERLTTIHDSIWITRVDTVKTYKNTQDWWDT